MGPARYPEAVPGPSTVFGEKPMDTALNDAAFRLVSHSRVTIDANFRAPGTDDARLAALRAQFRDAGPGAIAEALERARLLEDTAIQMADAFRGPGDGTHGPPLT